MDKDMKLREAIKQARKAFWNEIDGDTDLPEGFGIEIKGAVKTYDQDVGSFKEVKAREESIGKELQSFRRQEKEGEGDME